MASKAEFLRFRKFIILNDLPVLHLNKGKGLFQVGPLIERRSGRVDACAQRVIGGTPQGKVDFVPLRRTEVRQIVATVGIQTTW